MATYLRRTLRVQWAVWGPEQSEGVKGVIIVPDPGPAEPDDLGQGTISRRTLALFVCHALLEYGLSFHFFTAFEFLVLFFTSRDLRMALHRGWTIVVYACSAFIWT